jgi:hypothetical protein
MRPGQQTGAQAACLIASFQVATSEGVITMKKSRGGRMTAAKKRAAKSAGGHGLVKNRKAGRKIMKT